MVLMGRSDLILLRLRAGLCDFKMVNKTGTVRITSKRPMWYNLAEVRLKAQRR